MNNEESVLVILGPTAMGKTDVAVGLAKKFGGELVAADSRQVYKGLDIGTGKMPGKKVANHWQIEGVKIWGYDLVEPAVRFTVKDYIEFAQPKIGEIISRGKKPMVVGGTGLYLRALLEGMPNLGVPSDEGLRQELEQRSLTELQERLRRIGPEIWQTMNQSDRHNRRRLVRKIEIVLMSPYKDTAVVGVEPDYRILKIGLKAPIEVLDARIDRRIGGWIKQGLIEEANKLHQQGLSFERMRELGLEYGVLADLLEGKVDKAEFGRRLADKNHQYARRQLTWFKREKNVNWFDTDEPGWEGRLENLVSAWYNNTNRHPEASSEGSD